MTKYSISGRTFKIDEYRFRLDHLSGVSDVKVITSSSLTNVKISPYWQFKIIIGGQLINITDENEHSINEFHSELLESWFQKD